MKASWLFSKHPIIVDTDLATVIGLHEAIVLQQVNYWLHTKSGKTIDGRRWVYNSYPKWKRESFPFWSESTIKRVFTSLEKQGLLLSGNFNKAGFDKTKWYSIDIDKLNKLMDDRSGQNDPTMRSNWTDGGGQNDPMEEVNLSRPIPETTRDYTETTTDKIYSSPAKKQDEPPIPYKEIISYLNKKTGAHYKPSSKTTQRLIRARWHDGFKVKDFKTVIDNKCFDWQGDKKMSKYLRPATLFGSKFEDYLNENNIKSNKVGDADKTAWEKQLNEQFKNSAMNSNTMNNIDDDDLPF